MAVSLWVVIGGWGTKEEVTPGGVGSGRQTACDEGAGVRGVRLCVARL